MNNDKRIFIVKSLAFLATFALCMFFLERAARTVYPQTSEVAKVAKLFFLRAPKAQILFLGNSHVSASVLCDEINPGCYDGSIPGQDLYYTSQIFRKEVERFAKLKLVIVGISYLSLTFCTEDSLFYDAREYLEEFGIWPKSGRLLPLAIANSMILTHRASFFSDFLQKKMAGPRVAGAAPDPSSQWRNRHLTGLGHSGAYDRLLPEHKRAIEVTIEEAQKRGIAISFVTFPVSASYYSGYLPVKNQLITQQIRDVVAEYQGVNYYDFSQLDRLDESDFQSDGHHMNRKGAIKFSQYFKEWLEEKYPGLMTEKPHRNRM